jgi:hypothetical protein
MFLVFRSLIHRRFNFEFSYTKLETMLIYELSYEMSNFTHQLGSHPTKTLQIIFAGKAPTIHKE